MRTTLILTIVLLFTLSIFLPHTTAIATAKLGYVYWTDLGANKIQKASLDGTNIQDIATGFLGRPVSITLDLPNEKMYWTDL